MSKNLGWAWKPDDTTKGSEWSRGRVRKAKKKRETKRQKLLRAPGRIFYESREWKTLRKKVLKHYGWRCMSCDAVDVEIHIDHIRPRSKAPHLSLTFSNLQVLCRACNMEKSNIHSEDYRNEAIKRQLDRKLLLEAERAI